MGERGTKVELAGLVGNGDGVAGDPPWTGLGVLRGERSRPNRDVDPLHRSKR